MRVVVVGLGVQGKKRCRVAGDDLVCTVDPINPEADYKSLFEIPLEKFDAALLCVPDNPKMDLIDYLVTNKKSVLVEKPLYVKNSSDLLALEKKAKANSVQVYTAYNHRFEPHFMEMASLINSGKLGKVYSCRMFYGNGTASLVRASDWRDEGAGVLPDLGSHLLDTLYFWFGDQFGKFRVISSNCFENAAPDHVVLGSFDDPMRVELEMTLLMWRNSFTCDVMAERGTAHIDSLCKWGPSTFTERWRVFPSGVPDEKRFVLKQADPTWHLEYEFFKDLIETGAICNLDRDIWLNSTLSNLCNEIISGRKNEKQ